MWEDIIILMTEIQVPFYYEIFWSSPVKDFCLPFQIIHEYPCFGLWEEICSIRFIPLNKGAAWRSKPTPKVDRHHSSLVSVDTVPEAGWEERAVGIWDLEFQDCPKSRYWSQRPAYPFLLQLILSVQGPPKGFFMPDFGLLFSDTNVPDLCSHFLHGWLDSIQCCMKGKRTVCLSRLSIFSPSRVPCASGSRRMPPPPRSLPGCPQLTELYPAGWGCWVSRHSPLSAWYYTWAPGLSWNTASSQGQTVLCISSRPSGKILEWRHE